MQFVVNGSWIENGALVSPETMIPILQQAVIPSLEQLAAWEEQGKIHGGVFAGERETTFILQAASGEEVGQLLTSLPFWGMMKWHVRPLQSMRSCVERERVLVDHMKPSGGAP